MWLFFFFIWFNSWTKYKSCIIRSVRKRKHHDWAAVEGKIQILANWRSSKSKKTICVLHEKLFKTTTGPLPMPNFDMQTRTCKNKILILKFKIIIEIFYLHFNAGQGGGIFAYMYYLVCCYKSFSSSSGSSLHFQIWRLRDRAWFGQTQQQKREQKNSGFLSFNQKPKAVSGACWLPGTNLAPTEIMNTWEKIVVI